jgi:hypothetical protein
MTHPTPQPRTWWNNKAELQRVNALLAEAARKHAAELNAGKPLNLKLVKQRQGGN